MAILQKEMNEWIVDHKSPRHGKCLPKWGRGEKSLTEEGEKKDAEIKGKLLISFFKGSLVKR